jgi:hypothetical protein
MTGNGMEKLCTKCWSKRVPHARNQAGFTTCLPCGEKAARQKRHTIVPMHKSNYMVVTDLIDLKGINNKGGFHR